MYDIQKKGSTGKNARVFSLRYCKNCISNEDLTHTCKQTGQFFPKSRQFLSRQMLIPRMSFSNDLGVSWMNLPGTSLEPQDVAQKTFKVRLRNNVGSSVGCPWISLYFSFGTYSIDQMYLKAIQHSRCIENPVKLLRWSIFCKIS